jgi:serine/threonine protein kinase
VPVTVWHAKEVLSKIKDKPHDRIIKAIDFGTYSNQDYEIMEFAEGGTLSEYLEKNAIRDVKQFKNIVKMINEALVQMHDEYNAIYQDLKPDNILFIDTNKTKLVLADFGTASVMEKDDKKAKVVASLTDLYGALELSPKTGHKYVFATPAVDYYSLGITMIEMWLGEKPFKNIQPVDRDYMISEERVDFPTDMPVDCKTLIQGLLKHNFFSSPSCLCAFV